MLLPLIGFLLLFWVLSRLDHRAVVSALARIPPTSVALAAAVFFTNVVIKAIRWRRILDGQGIALPWSVAMSGFFIGAFYGTITIGRMGEFLRAGVLVERGHSMGAALVSCFFDRVLDLLTLLVLAALFAGFILEDPGLSGLIAVGVLGGLVLLRWLLLRGQKWAESAHRKSSNSSVGRLQANLRDLLAASPTLGRPRVLLEALGWTLVSWWFYLGTIWVLASGLGIDTSRLTLSTATILAALSTLLPITFQGVGTRELIFIALLGRENVPQELAAALGLVTVAVFLGTATVAGGIGLVWRQRLPSVGGHIERGPTPRSKEV